MPLDSQRIGRRSQPNKANTRSRSPANRSCRRYGPFRLIREWTLDFFPEGPSDENIMVGPVSGRLTANAALAQLLQPNGLAYEWINERSVHIVKQQPTNTTAQASETATVVADVATNEGRGPGRDRKPHHDAPFVVVIGTRLS